MSEVRGFVRTYEPVETGCVDTSLWRFELHHDLAVRPAGEVAARGDRPCSSSSLDDGRSHPDVQLDQRSQARGGAAPVVHLGRAGYELAPSLERPGLVELDAHPAREPLDEVLWCEARVEVGPEVVERRRRRRQHLVETLAPALDELVLVVQRGQRATDRRAHTEIGHEAARHEASTSTWCSNENTSAFESSSRRCTA
jgi:hypothetical protein